MSEKKVIIIGAGISGLCAGNYLQMNDYDTEIFELHDKCGGLCTAWKRKEYTFDGCIHWLAGSIQNDPFYKLWNEIINMGKIKFVDQERKFRFISKDDSKLDLFVETSRLQEELLKLAPEDTVFIKKFIKIIKKFKKFKTPVNKAVEVMTILEKIKLLFSILPFIRQFIKYSKISVAEQGMKCKNPLLRKVLTHNKLFNNSSFIGLIMSLAWASRKSAGYPIGGSLPFVRQFEKNFLKLGGKIHYRSMVSSITVDNNVAKGIELSNGEKYSADIVISAADGNYTIYNMLNGKYVNEKIEDMYKDRDKFLVTFPSLIYISIGVSNSLKGIPHQIVYEIDKSIIIDDMTESSYLNVTIYNFDPTLAPEGKCSILVMFETFAYKYWTKLKENNPKEYKEKKQAIAEKVINILDNKIGNIKENVEVFDVATPATFIRYTNNWKGSYEGWLPRPGGLMQNLSKELPGLESFYMIGQWVQPGGGLPTGILSGRNITQIICKKDKKLFKIIKRN